MGVRDQYKTVFTSSGPAVHAYVLTDGDASVAEVQVVTKEGAVFATARSAKKHPKDRDDMEIGVCLAMGRALKDAGELVEKHAEMLVEVAQVKGTS